MKDEQDQVEEQDQVTEEDQANKQGQQSKETDIELKLAQMEERYKKELAGLNKTVSKLAKEKEALEMEKLSEEERAKAEREKAVKEAEEIRSETAKLRRERDLTKVLFDVGLDPELFQNRIVGETFEEMKADAEILKATISKTVETGIESEIKTRLGGEKPAAGQGTSKLSVEEQIKRAAAISAGRKY